VDTKVSVASNMEAEVGTLLAPPLPFIAPEILKNNTASSGSDAFAIGSLIYSLLQIATNGKNGYFFDIKDNCSKRAYLEQAERMTAGRIQAKLASYSEDTITLLQQLLAFNSNERIILQEAGDHKWFNDPKIKTLEYLDHLNEKEDQHKIQFLDGLGNVLNEFDVKVLLRRVLPKLAACLVMDKLSAHVLPSIAMILKIEGACSKPQFYDILWPHLKQLCRGNEITAQTLYLIIVNTETWIKYVSMQDFQTTLLLLYQKSIDCGIVKIQEKAVEIIPTFAKKVEYATLKNTLLPKVIKLATNTTEGKLRIKCIESLVSFSTVLDATTIKESVLPLLDKLSKNDTSGKLHLAIIRTIESFIKIFTYEELANKVIPLLLSMSVIGQFSKQQFSDVMNLIRKLIDKIDSSRSKVVSYLYP
jgi:SCY1-like protein 2